MIEKGSFVQIYRVVLSGNKRSSNLPKSTAVVPFEMRVKGVLVESANIGDTVKIKTATDRLESGILIAKNPCFTHGFGGHVQVLRDVRDIILSEVEGLDE